MAKVTLQSPHQGEAAVLDCAISGNQFAITLNTFIHEGRLSLTGPGEGWLTLADRILPFYMTRKEDTLSIWLAGKTYHLAVINPVGRRGATGGAAALSDGAIKAPMPGTVLKVLAQPGQAVEANQALIIMESMKMEMTLSAPHAAQVVSLHCQEGQLVDLGALLVKLEQAAQPE